MGIGWELLSFQTVLTLILGSLLPTFISCLLSLRHRASEVYSSTFSDQLLLNLKEPETRWMNLGYWKTGDGQLEEDFGKAAERLARMVGERAGLRQDGKQRICDVAFGSGDSILLWLKEYRPLFILGITSLPHQAHYARSRVTTAKTAENNTKIDLKVGDGAIALADLPPNSIDAIVCIDAAYHFKSRHSFLRHSYSALAPSSTLSLTDLCLPTEPLSYLDSLLLRLICYLAGLPFSNLLTIPSYTSSLSSLSYEAISIEDISPEVFPGFIAFMERRKREMGKKGVLNEKEWSKLRAYAKVVKWYSGVGGGKEKLKFVLVSARKGSAKEETKKSL